MLCTYTAIVLLPRAVRPVLAPVDNDPYARLLDHLPLADWGIMPSHNFFSIYENAKATFPIAIFHLGAPIQSCFHAFSRRLL